jgi:hypothetical protein
MILDDLFLAQMHNKTFISISKKFHLNIMNWMAEIMNVIDKYQMFFAVYKV